jgi:hypothetical protein
MTLWLSQNILLNCFIINYQKDRQRWVLDTLQFAFVLLFGVLWIHQLSVKSSSSLIWCPNLPKWFKVNLQELYLSYSLFYNSSKANRHLSFSKKMRNIFSFLKMFVSFCRWDFEQLQSASKSLKMKINKIFKSFGQICLKKFYLRKLIAMFIVTF